MSDCRTISFTCPFCETAFPVTQWIRMEPQSDPALRAHIMTGHLFQCDCPSCGKHIVISYNCLYQDTEKKFAVSLLAANSQTPVAPLLTGYRMRLENTLPDFIERIRILDAGLDDMAFELFRTVLLTKLRQQEGQKMPALRFDCVDDTHIFLQASPTERIKLPFSSYQTIADKVITARFRPKISGYLKIHGKWVKDSGIIQVLK